MLRTSTAGFTPASSALKAATCAVGKSCALLTHDGTHLLLVVCVVWVARHQEVELYIVLLVRQDAVCQGVSAAGTFDSRVPNAPLLKLRPVSCHELRSLVLEAQGAGVSGGTQAPGHWLRTTMERMSGGGRITPTAAVCVASVTEPAATLVDASARPPAAACETTSSIRATQHHYLQGSQQQAVLEY